MYSSLQLGFIILVNYNYVGCYWTILEIAEQFSNGRVFILAQQ